MPKFTPAQERAIKEQSKTLLVSAAAGSGKTTTLIERILRSVTREENPVMLDRLLVVTFTTASASDLRLRISKAISEAIANGNGSDVLSKQFALLNSAKISTIDSFCLDLVRSNYATLGLSPSFRIADEGEASLLAKETMEMLINECYDNQSSTICGGAKNFASLVDIIVGCSDDKRLVDTMLSLYTKLSSFPKGASALYSCEESLREYANHDFFDCPHGKRIERFISEFFEYYHKGYMYCLERIQLNEKLAIAYSAAFEDDLHNIFKIEKALKEGYMSGRNAILSVTFKGLDKYRGEKTDDFAFVKAFRDDYKKKITKTLGAYIVSSGNEIADSLIKTADICHMLGDFLCEYEKRAEAEKKRLGICEFSDLSRYTLRLLVDDDGNDTPFAIEQKALYDAVYIDEYQDVNAVQDRIFSAISTDTNRFMVGDIKQSIYAFRGAEPSIFANLRNEYPLYDENSKDNNGAIFMSENFRCNKEVIGFTNIVFDTVMPLISPEMNYTSSDSLVFGKRCEKDAHIPVKLVLAEAPPKDSPDYAENAEAHYIANEIQRLVKEETKDDGSPINYSDIAIIMRSPKDKVDTYANTLRAYGVPVYTETNENLLYQSEVEILLCMLEVIDNPRRDIPLAGILMSPLYNISYDFIAALRNRVRDERLFTTIKKYVENEDNSGEEKEKLATFINQLTEFRSMARFMNACELIDELYTRYSICARLCASSPLRRANLEKLRQVAYEYSATSVRSLSEFLRYINNIETNARSQIPAARPAPGSVSAVSIISIHKSKGLEYPVVFFSDTHKGYNFMDAYNPILYSGKTGFAMKLRDDSGFGVYNTMLRKSVSLALIRATKEEELRLMYVALTRAKERLYMTASMANPHKLIENAKSQSKFMTEYSASRLTNYIELALLATKGDDSEHHITDVVDYYPYNVTDTVSECDDATEITVDENAVEILNSRFDSTYKNIARTKIPAKLAISRLYPDILDDTISGDTIEQKKLPRATLAPRFIANDAESDAAKRGTATHLFMQFFDFDNAATNGAAAELARLKEKRFLTESDAAIVNLEEVSAFLNSQLFKDMCTSKKIYREQRFNLNLDASDFAADEGLKTELSGETVLVQGVIDCFFYDRDDNIILVDYKTDRVDKNNIDAAKAKLRSTHENQLKYYAQAIEEICGKPPKKTLVYSLCLSDTVEI